MTTLGEPIAAAAGRGTGPCAASEVRLSATPIAVGAAVPGYHSEVHGCGVDERYVYATCGLSGVEDGHDSPPAGELVVFDREQLAAAVQAGTAPPERRIGVGRQPRSVASLVRPDFERVFVVNYHQASYSVTVLDRRTWATLSEVPIGMTPIDVAVHAGRGRAYVTDAYHGVRAIDARTGTEVAGERVEIGREVLGLAVDEATDTLFVVHNKQYGEPPIDQLVVVDLETRAVADRISFRARSSPRDVAYDPATGFVYVGMTGPADAAGRLGVLRLDRKALTAPPVVLPTGGIVLGVAVATASDGARVYATVNDRLEVLDPTANERVGSVSLAKRLGPVAVDRVGGEVYAGDLHDGRLFRVAPVPAAGPIGRHPLVADGSLGPALGAPRPGPDGQAVVQPFRHGLAVASADYGAVALRDGHQAAWLAGRSAGRDGGRATRVASSRLGNPASDTADVGGRAVTYFQDGVLVTTDSGVAVEVSGAIWQRYRDGGDVTGGYGLPLAAEVASPVGGGHQEFADAVIFHRGNGDAATVVWRGPLWDAWVASFGGPGGPLGFPTGDSTTLHQPDVGLPVASWLQLELGALVWNATDGGVHELSPELWRAWQQEGGASGRLGLPNSGVRTSPHDPASPVRFAEFQLGTIVWFPEGHPLRPSPPDPEYTVVTSLELRITGFRALEADQNNPDNPPDPYVDHWVSARHAAGEDPYLRWEGRLPGDDDHWQDVRDVEYHHTEALADLVRGDLVVNVAFHCWDHDTLGDDLLGRIETSYTVDNLWGLRDVSDEHHDRTDEGEFFAYFTTKPKDAPTDLEGNFRGRFFWRFQNFDTERLSTEVYERAFSDIEPGVQFHVDPVEWLHEGWESFFYHAFFKSIAQPGNCYGMSAEAVEAFAHRSRFAQPIFQHGHPRDALDPGDELYGTPDPAFPEDVELMEALNVRHGTQLGDRVVRWAADHILATIGGGGAINNGVEIFSRTKAAFERGDWPVLNMLKEWKKGGHTVLPIRWLETTDGYEILLADPSKRPEPPGPGADVTDGKERIVIGADGHWRYLRMVDGAWTDVGSYNSFAPRWLMYVPSSRFRHLQRSPSTEFAAAAAVVALVGSPFLLLGDADTHQISDAAGRTTYEPGLGRAPLTPLDLRSDPGGFVPGLHRIPVFGGEDAPVDGEFHYATGRHEALAHDVVPRRSGGRYSWGMRHGAMAAMVFAPTDSRADRIQAENLGSATRAVSFGRAKASPPKTVEMMLEAFPRLPLPPSRVPADRRTRQFLLQELAVAGGQRVVARPSDGGNELLVSSYGAPASFAVRLRGATGTPLSRARRVTVEEDRTVVLRPARWSVEALDSAPLPIEVRERPDGPRVRCYEAVPEGPANR